MWRDLGMIEQDWERTPPAVRSLLVSLKQQVRLLEIRCAAYERELMMLRQQATRIEDLQAEIAELRERLGQTSRNSSRPPSSDPPHQKRRASGEPTGRASGGQPGHQGRGRGLKPVEEVDHVVELRPACCVRCGQLLLGDDPHPERHQVSDVPRAKAEVTEYRRHTVPCLACGAANQAPWPEEMPRGSFGPRAQAIIGYLAGRLGTSQRDAAEAMAVLHGLEVSVGSVSAIERQVSEALAAAVAGARQFVARQRAQYVDETSWPEGGQQKWLWVNATAEVTAFQVLAGRGTKQAKTVIDEAAKGVITSDRLGSYNWLTQRRRQVCWSHLTRDFRAMAERTGDSAEVGQALLRPSRRTLQAVGSVARGGDGPRPVASGDAARRAASQRAARGRLALDAPEDASHLSEDPQAVGRALDLCAGGRCRADQQCGGTCVAAGSAVAAEIVWDAE